MREEQNNKQPNNIASLFAGQATGTQAAAKAKVAAKDFKVLLSDKGDNLSFRLVGGVLKYEIRQGTEIKQRLDEVDSKKIDADLLEGIKTALTTEQANIDTFINNNRSKILTTPFVSDYISKSKPQVLQTGGSSTTADLNQMSTEELRSFLDENERSGSHARALLTQKENAENSVALHENKNAFISGNKIIRLSDGADMETSKASICIEMVNGGIKVRNKMDTKPVFHPWDVTNPDELKINNTLIEDGNENISPLNRPSILDFLCSKGLVGAAHLSEINSITVADIGQTAKSTSAQTKKTIQEMNQLELTSECKDLYLKYQSTSFPTVLDDQRQATFLAKSATRSATSQEQKFASEITETLNEQVKQLGNPQELFKQIISSTPELSKEDRDKILSDMGKSIGNIKDLMSEPNLLSQSRMQLIANETLLNPNIKSQKEFFADLLNPQKRKSATISDELRSSCTQASKVISTIDQIQKVHEILSTRYDVVKASFGAISTTIADNTRSRTYSSAPALSRQSSPMRPRSSSITSSDSSSENKPQQSAPILSASEKFALLKAKNSQNNPAPHSSTSSTPLVADAPNKSETTSERFARLKAAKAAQKNL